MQLSSVIGKPVLSPTGENYGYVTDARLSRDFSRISCLVCADGEEEEFYVPLRAVLSCEDAVIAGKARIAAPTGVLSPIGKRVFSHTGESLGTVSDVLLGEGSEAVLILVKEGVRTTAPVSCAGVEEHAVIYPDAEAKTLAAKRNQRPRAAADPPRKKRTPPKRAQEEPAAPPPETENEAPMPEKNVRENVFPLDRTNLLGRRVKRSVFDEYGAPVALAGERITPAVLARARRCNRLLQLTVNTLTSQF